MWIARQPDTNLKIKAFWAIAFLSIALGHNHLQGWGANVSEPKPFHIVFSLGNLLALVWAAGCLIYERVWQPNRY